MMTDKNHSKIINSRTFELLKIKRSKALSIQNSGIGNPMYGKNSEANMSKEAILLKRKRQSLALKGRIFSLETRQKISQVNTGRIISKETRKKISNTLTGFKHTQESKNKMSLHQRGKKKPPRSELHKKRLSLSAFGKHDGKLNGCFGRKWMHHPITQDKVYPKKEDIQKYLDLGYIFGVNNETRNKNKGHFIFENGKRKFIPNKD